MECARNLRDVRRTSRPRIPVRPLRLIMTRIAENHSVITPIAENLWCKTYPLKMLGLELGRRVTIVRLSSGKLVIHSTAPFTAGDVAEVRALGQPGWILDAILRHDTFAAQGHAAFPDVPFLAPRGFPDVVKFITRPIVPPPAEWNGELEVIELDGMREARETVFFHHASRTLIVADLMFHFPEHGPWWKEFMLKAGAVAGEHDPGMPRSFKHAISDREALKRSLARVMAWDFDRVIVGHGEIVERDGKAQMSAMLQHAGL